MGLRLNHNSDALSAYRHLASTSNLLQQSLARLSSNLRINHASDDPAGLGISERMRAQISGLGQAQRNAQDGISMAQVADGALQSVSSILNRVRELAMQFNSGTYSAADKAAITQEVASLSAEITSILTGTKWGNVALLSGGGALLTLQVGPGNSDFMTISGSSAANAIGAILNTFVNTGVNATVDLDAIDTAASNIASQNAMYGAVSNRLSMTVDRLSSYEGNLTEAESRIRDLDVAAEMVNFTRLQILQQTSMALLAQANQQPSTLLKLLGG